MIKLYFSTVKILAQWPTHISDVATVLLITKKERGREEGRETEREREIRRRGEKDPPKKTMIKNVIQEAMHGNLPRDSDMSLSAG